MLGPDEQTESFNQTHKNKMTMSGSPVPSAKPNEGYRMLPAAGEDRLKGTQENLEQSEARLSGIISSAIDAIITVDEAQRVTGFNNAAEQMFGWAATDAVGESIERFIPRRFWTMNGRHIGRSDPPDITKLPRGTLGTLCGSRANGEEFPIDVSIAEFRVQEGTLNTIIILRDVTERVRQEEALQEREARYRDLVQALPAAIYTCDEQGYVTLYNQAAVDLWGQEPEAGKDLWCGSWKIYRPDGVPLPLDQCPMAITLREGRAIRGQEIVIERPDGTRRHVLPHPEPLRNTAGECIGALNMLVDVTESKEAEQALRRSERDLSDFFENASTGMHWVGPDGIILRVNQTELDMLGYRRDEYVGRHISEFHVDQPVIQDILVRLTGGETLHDCPARLRCKDGSIRDVLINSSVLFEDGTFIHARCFTRDVTGPKRAEEALRLSEARYRELIQALPAAVYICDERGYITLYNQAAVVLWGREPEIGKDLWCGSWKIYRPDGTPLPLDECPMAATLREGRAIRGEEFVIERPDGTRRQVLPHPKPIRNTEGVVVGAINILIDVSYLQQAERALAHLAAIVMSSEDAIISKNLQGIVTSWNGAAERLFGYTAEEMIGQPVSRLIPPERHNEEPDILDRIKRGDSIHHYETIRRRKDGTDLHISLTVSPLIDHHGKIIGASKISRDITEQKRVEEKLQERDRALTALNDALQKQTAELAESNKELEGFSYSVSHDLRSPLRTIDAFVRIMEEDHGPHLNAEVQRCLTIIRNAAVQAGELIDDLLEFSRLGRQGMSFRSVMMTDLVREAADEVRMVPEGRKIDFVVGELPPCRGDHRLLKLVWINLLTNAFKYTKNRSEARVEVGWMPDEKSAAGITYFVKDDGIGFDMKYVHKLFGVFQRLHRKEDFDGTGVGLAIVQRIVQRHGGRVWAEGKVNGGATFFFSLGRATA